MKPRARFRLLYWAPVVLACVTGYTLDRRATALRVSEFDRRFEQLSARLDELSASMKKSSAVCALSADSSGAENPPRPSGGMNKGYVCRPRVMGSGRTGHWLYTDIRHVDGQVLRYYLREGSSPAQVHAFVRRIAEDSKDRAFAAELMAN